MAGLEGLSKSAASGLQESLAGQSAPANPATPANPADRKDPNEAYFLDVQRIRKSADVAASHAEESDPKALLFGGISATMTRLLTSIELSEAVDVLLERLFPLSSPQLKQRLAMMFAPISPPVGPGGGAGGLPPQGGAGAATGQPPAGGPLGAPGGDAGTPPA